MTGFVSTLNRSEYLAIEEAIAATAKGRAFLRDRDEISRVIGSDQVGKMMRGLQDWIAGGQDNVDRRSLDTIRKELSDVRAHIHRAKEEIADLSTESQGDGTSRIRGATAELDEIVNATAAATNDILSAAEAISSTADALPADQPDAKQAITDRCMEIFQACSFQDITGQRIAKVVKTLNFIEQRVNAMIDHWSPLGESGDASAGAKAVVRPAAQLIGAAATADDDKRLLNGPQLPGNGLGQDAVDALMDPQPAAKPASSAPISTSEKVDQQAIDAMFS